MRRESCSLQINWLWYRLYSKVKTTLHWLHDAETQLSNWWDLCPLGMPLGFILIRLSYMGRAVLYGYKHSLRWDPGQYKSKKSQESTFIHFSLLLGSGCKVSLSQVSASIHFFPIMDSKLKLYGKVNLSLLTASGKVILTKLPRRGITTVKHLCIGSGRGGMVYVFWEIQSLNNRTRSKAPLTLPVLTIMHWKEEKHRRFLCPYWSFPLPWPPKHKV